MRWVGEHFRGFATWVHAIWTNPLTPRHRSIWRHPGSPLWPCCPCALSLSPSRASPSSPKTISIAGRPLCWLSALSDSHHTTLPSTPSSLKLLRHFWLQQEDQGSVPTTLPLRVAVLVPAFSGTLPIFEGFKKKQFQVLWLAQIWWSRRSLFLKWWLLQWWTRDYLIFFFFRFSISLWAQEMRQSSVESTVEASASLLVVHHFGFSRNKSSPECELQCWFQSSWVWFLRDFFFASALVCSNLEIEENTSFQVMINTVVDARFFEYWVLSPFWH